MERKIINIRLLRWGFQAFLEKSRILILRTKPEGFQTFMAQLVWRPSKVLGHSSCCAVCWSLLSIQKFPYTWFLWYHSWVPRMWNNQSVSLFNHLCGSHTSLYITAPTLLCMVIHKKVEQELWLPQDKLLLSLWNDSLNYPLSKFLGVCLYISSTFFLSPSIVDRISQRWTRISS